MDQTKYQGTEGAVAWRGIELSEGEEFHRFIGGEVADRLNDSEQSAELDAALKGLATTGFESDNLTKLLAAEEPEKRDWAIGEALSEVWLQSKHDVVWPWNMERDKRTPFASLPGADLVGFIESEGHMHLVIGEVKTSSDKNTPPNVMNGKSGMANQLDRLVSELTLLNQLVRWLWPRCKETNHETSLFDAIGRLIQSDFKAIHLFGVLIRDTNPEEKDLSGRAASLGSRLRSPTVANLIALYLPCAVSDLPHLISGEAQS